MSKQFKYVITATHFEQDPSILNSLDIDEIIDFDMNNGVDICGYFENADEVIRQMELFAETVTRPSKFNVDLHRNEKGQLVRILMTPKNGDKYPYSSFDIYKLETGTID